MNTKCLYTAALILLVPYCVLGDGAPPAQNFDALFADAQAKLQNISQHVTHMLGLPDIQTGNQTELFKTFKDQATQVGNQVQEFISKVQANANDKNTGIGSAIASLNETVNSLQTPEVQQKTKKFEQTIAESYNTIIEQVGKVAKEVNQEAQPNGSLHQISSNAIEKLLDIAKNFESKIHNVTNHQHAGHEGHR